jgi:tRNA threonylcarbamoyl adenosine modification protein YeaZ
MLVLGIEASGNSASVALVMAGKTMASVTRPDRHGHASWITEMVDDLLAEAKSDFAAISHIAVGCGPGSFTGIRVGLAAAHGYGLGLDVPVLGVSSLAALAHGSQAGDEGDHLSVALIDTRRGNLFAQGFSGGREISDVVDVSHDELVDHIPALIRDHHNLGAVGLHLYGFAASKIATTLTQQGVAIADAQDKDPDAIMAAKMVTTQLRDGALAADFPATPRYHSAPLLGPLKANPVKG